MRSLDAALAPTPPVDAVCECGHHARQHWIGGPTGIEHGCEGAGCECGA